jgi:hypothetical protein
MRGARQAAQARHLLVGTARPRTEVRHRGPVEAARGKVEARREAVVAPEEKGPAKAGTGAASRGNRARRERIGAASRQDASRRRAAVIPAQRSASRLGHAPFGLPALQGPEPGGAATNRGNAAGFEAVQSALDMVRSRSRAWPMTTKFPPSPLLGYNNNVRHKGKVFHIQTEDSGVKYGHIITHLFMDGGRILKSVKTGYAEYIGNERMGEIVREMMKQQHKAMFIALRDGKFDAIAEGAADVSQATRAVVAEAPPAPSPAEPPAAAPPPAPSSPRPGPSAKTVPAGSGSARGPLAAPAEPIRSGPAYALTQPFASAAPADDAPATVRQPEAELTLDIGALERAASGAHASSPGMRQASELPPPPANLFRDRGGMGKYRMTPVPPASASGQGGAQRAATPPPSTKPGPGSSSVAPGSRGTPPGAAPGERRYAPTRPAAIFGQARPQPNKSVFGEDLISDKSLDEVILSYLAEDLDERK